MSYARSLACGLSLLLVTTGVAQAEPDRQITVSGEAVVKVVPDEALVSVGVETYEKDASTTVHENNERIHRVLALASRFGIEPRFVKTDYISLQPRYDNSSGHEHVLLGYTAHKSVVFTLHDLSKLEGLLTASIDAGANVMDGVEFRTTELRKYRDKAREMAIQAAQEKARALAGSLGQKIGPARSIGENGVGSYWYGPRRSQGYYQTQNAMSNAGGESVGGDTVAPGEIQVSATVSVTFDLSP